MRRFTKEDYTVEHAIAHARRYDEGQRNIKLKKVSKQLTGIKGKLILDLGCGVGTFSDLCSEFGASVVAMDHADAMISATKQRYVHKFPLLQCDAKLLPFRDNLFEIVIALDVIEHFYELETIFKEIHRVTKADSEMLITTPKAGLSVGYLHWAIGGKVIAKLPTVLRSFIKRRFSSDTNSKHATLLCTHVKLYKPSEISQIAEDNGFRLDYMDTFPNRKSFGIWGHLVEFLFVGFLRKYKWHSAIYKFKKQSL